MIYTLYKIQNLIANANKHHEYTTIFKKKPHKVAREHEDDWVMNLVPPKATISNARLIQKSLQGVVNLNFYIGNQTSLTLISSNSFKFN